MEIRIGSTVVTLVISFIDSEVKMSKEQLENERKYLGTMTVARNLLKQGVISDEEYRQIDTKFKEIYAVSLSTIFTDISLITAQ